VILVDTSVWVDHLRRGNPGLSSLLARHLVLMHPFVLGELACGNMRQRCKVLGLLADLPAAIEAQHDEVLHYIENHRLMGRGLGFVDTHLLAAAALNTPARIWTLDRRLRDAALELDLAIESA